MQIPRSFKRKQIQVEKFLQPHQELRYRGRRAFISPRHHLRLPQPRLKETLFGQGPSPTRSLVSAPVWLNHLIIDRRRSWACEPYTRRRPRSHAQPDRTPAFLITPKTLTHGGLIHPFLPLSSFQLHSMLSQCTKESREEVLRFPASLWWQTRCLYSIIDKGSRLQFTLISPWTLCLLDYISSCSKISFTILHRAFRLLRLDSKDQS